MDICVCIYIMLYILYYYILYINYVFSPLRAHLYVLYVNYIMQLWKLMNDSYVERRLMR